MLIKLHSKCYANPINIAAVICGQIAVTVRLTNGRSHNIECRDIKNGCPALYGSICDELRKHIDMIQFHEARELTAVNVDHVLSIAGTKPGVTVNMAGDWTIILPCGMSSQGEKMAKISQALEAYK